MVKKTLIFCTIIVSLLISATTLNNPHIYKNSENVRSTSFSESPKTLDPALAYFADEMIFIAQIYEPVLQYHYFKRPYELVPLTAAKMIDVSYLDSQGKVLSENAPAAAVANSVYRIQIKPNILYQPHPAFAKDKNGNLLYLHLSPEDLKSISKLSDFKQTGTRELTADDYAYQIKRLANPKLNSPIFGFMSNYILGFKEFAEQVQKNPQQDLRQIPLEGVKVIDRYNYEIIIKGKYPQFKYWLAMTFFSPIPWEAEQFYAQKGMKEKNLTLDWYPVGTGPYMLIENNPNREMVLERNPNFHGEVFPELGTEKNPQYQAKTGQKLPFIDKYIFVLEKESIPRWNKFLQGYYDVSEISSDSFDQAVRIDENGQPQLTPNMERQKIKLQTSVSPDIYYYGFNMLDNVVGGYSDQARKLRQAISIALNMEEYITIFLNGRGLPAQGPIPPGIFGYKEGKEGVDPYIYDWSDNKPTRKTIAYARELLAQAGYPNGRNEKTGKPLILNLDIVSSNAPDDKARFDWLREQFGKLNIQLNIRATQANRFQDKLRTGQVQIFLLGWLPDYPDPENFLFLFYGSNSKVKYSGENTSNYANPEYDRLYEQMKMLPDDAERLQIINKMVAILQRDAVWIWGFYPKHFLLSHSWVGPTQLDAMGNNTLKYQWIEPKLRAEQQNKWNQIVIWPFILMLILLVAAGIPIAVKYYNKQHSPRIKKISNADKHAN